MSGQPAGRVLHLVPPNGGGVDRFVRDICAHRTQDWILHVTDGQCVVEVVDGRRFIPLDIDALERLASAGALGRPAALHAHSTVAAVRDLSARLGAALQLPYVLTLHDVQFDAVTADDPAEHGRRIDYARGAVRRTVPSGFILALARQALGAGAPCTLLENGVDPHPASMPAVTPPQARCAIAVIGALGRHKGLQHLRDVAQRLPADLRVVLFGYTDGQLEPGWIADGKIRVHGTFEPVQLPALAQAYGAELAFFPAGAPESYCYALSDAWLAGLPVLGPDWGAIGERVRAHGGGWTYATTAAPEELAGAIGQALQAVRRGEARAGDAARSLQPVEVMVNQLNLLYGEVAAGPQAPADLDALQQAAAMHLDSRVFRQELLRLQGDLAATRQERANALAELAAMAEQYEKRGQWIAHLEGDAQAMRNDLQALQAQVDELRRSFEIVRHENEKLKRWLRLPLMLVRGVRRLLGTKGR